MFGWFRNNKKTSHTQECLDNHVVSESKYKMISHKGRLPIDKIATLLPELEKDAGSIGFYVVSKCIHGFKHNNRILLWHEPGNKVLIEVQRPQDLCLCSSYYKSVSFNEFSEVLGNMSEVISKPKEIGFEFQEWE